MKRIFMLSRHALFCEGIESLLKCDAELEFIGREANVDDGIRRIYELRPDVVIFDDNSATSDTSAMTLILQRWLGIEVIGLNLRENTIYCHGEQKAVEGPDDLRQAINIAHSQLGVPSSE
ncbi:MAG: response regulator transcription factor [Chloroflexi bacterium]|nr:response regulator transcription factor [Chloroflexota bacterium]